MNRLAASMLPFLSYSVALGCFPITRHPLLTLVPQRPSAVFQSLDIVACFQLYVRMSAIYIDALVALGCFSITRHCCVFSVIYVYAHYLHRYLSGSRLFFSNSDQSVYHDIVVYFQSATNIDTLAALVCFSIILISLFITTLLCIFSSIYRYIFATATGT